MKSTNTSTELTLAQCCEHFPRLSPCICSLCCLSLRQPQIYRGMDTLLHEAENRYFIKNRHDFTAAAQLVEMRTYRPNIAAPADPAQQCPRYPFLALPPGTNINPNPKAPPFPAAVSQPGTDTRTHLTRQILSSWRGPDVPCVQRSCRLPLG